MNMTNPAAIAVDADITAKVSAERMENEAKALKFAVTHAGKILSTSIDCRSVWMDGGEYYDQLSAIVWDGEKTVGYVVCDNSTAAWNSRDRKLPTLVADATPEVRAAYEAKLAREHMERIEEAERIERRRVKVGCFAVVHSGRKVPVGTVGRVFHIMEGERGRRVGMAVSSRTTPVQRNGRTYHNATDIVWTDINNVASILPACPTDSAKQDVLYKHAGAVLEHCEPEDFADMWVWAMDSHSRLAVMAAFKGSDLPMKDADTRYTIEDLCDAVWSDTGGAAKLLGVLIGVANPELETIRQIILSVLGPVFVPPAKTRKPRKAKV